MIRKEADLSGIKVIDNETQWILKAGDDVLNNALRMLLQGLETQNQGEVAAALLVFYNLGTLKSKVEATVTSITEKVFESIRAVLTITVPSVHEDLQSRGKKYWTCLIACR